jgi:hypothetical protein
MKSSVIATINQGELFMKSSSSGDIVWKGKIEGLDFKEIKKIPGSEDFIVLLDWRAAIDHSTPNVYRINHKGMIIWKIGEPQNVNPNQPARRGVGVYSSIELQANQLTGFDMNGFIDTIDIKNGSILNTVFVK